MATGTIAEDGALDPLAFLLIVLVLVAVVVIVAAPLLVPGWAGRAGERGERLAALEARKESKYREIRDAELDLRAGKLSRDDHRRLDRALRGEAIAILREIDELSKGNGEQREGGR